MKKFLKATETIVVLGGLFLTVLLGDLFAYITAVVYTVLNIPNALAWIKSIGGGGVSNPTGGKSIGGGGVSNPTGKKINETQNNNHNTISNVIYNSY